MTDLKNGWDRITSDFTPSENNKFIPKILVLWTQYIKKWFTMHTFVMLKLYKYFSQLHCYYISITKEFLLNTTLLLLHASLGLTFWSNYWTKINWMKVHANYCTEFDWTEIIYLTGSMRCECEINDHMNSCTHGICCNNNLSENRPLSTLWYMFLKQCLTKTDEYNLPKLSAVKYILKHAQGRISHPWYGRNWILVSPTREYATLIALKMMWQDGSAW